MRFILMTFVFAGFLSAAYSQKKPGKNILNKQAPDSFQVKFETTKGNFTAYSKRCWSPKAVDRFYQLVRTHYYDGTAIFRVQAGYVAQFGICSDSLIYKFWNDRKVADEPVLEKNTKGSISFARGGPETRTTQLFINLRNNEKLDTIMAGGIKGYPVIAKITDGADVTLKFFNEYGFEPAQKQDSISRYGNTYLKKRYPNLDYITKVELVK